MSFVIYTDAASNLPGDQIQQHNIRVLPCTYTLDGAQHIYNGDIASFDAKQHYDLLRAGHLIQTSLLNTQLFLDHFRPALEEGLDIIYVGMSSGISGTYNAAKMAAEELMEEFSDRKIYTVDSRGAGLGTGILTLRGADFREAGMSVDEAYQALLEATDNLCEYFTVDDLMFLNRTGRLSGAGAMVGTMLNIKPIIYVDNTGHLINISKVRGRKAAMELLANKLGETGTDFDTVFIAHGDCPEDAAALETLVKEKYGVKNVITGYVGPVIGAHTGPGVLVVFFMGTHR